MLEEWHRVLRPGGKLFVSVPDFDAAIRLYLKLGMGDYIRNILWGDQGYDLAFHYTGFTFPVLLNLLHKAGFKNMKKLKWMPYGIKDCSHNVDTVNKDPISLTMEATA